MDVCAVIEEANCCAAKMAGDYVDVATFGNKNDELFFNLLKLNAYIRTLQRNVPETYTKKVKIPIEGTYVDFSDLKKQNNTLSLDVKCGYTCVETTIQKCLSDSELCSIIEQIRLLCTNCNCNCN